MKKPVKDYVPYESCNGRIKFNGTVDITSTVDCSTLGLKDWYFGTNEKENLPKKVLFNEKKKAVTLLDEFDNVTVVRATKGDKYDKKFGFLLAYFQQNCGLTKTQANKYLKEILEVK